MYINLFDQCTNMMLTIHIIALATIVLTKKPKDIKGKNKFRNANLVFCNFNHCVHCACLKINSNLIDNNIIIITSL